MTFLQRLSIDISPGGYTYESEYKPSSMRNQSKTERSRKQITVWEAESDKEDMLVSNVQSNPTQTTIYGDAKEREVSHGSNLVGIRITRTVDASPLPLSRDPNKAWA